MSERNVENLRAWIERWNVEAWTRGGETDTSLLDPEVVYEDTVLPDHVGETYRGYEGIVRATQRWLEPFEDVTLDLEEILGTGEHLVSIIRARARARQTGIEFDMRYAYHWTFRDAKIIRGKSFLDPADALKDAGLEQ